MEISRNQFLAVVQACMPGTGKSASIVEGAENIVFDGSTARTYNDLVSVSVPFEVPGLLGAVKAAELSKLVSKLNGDSMEIEVDDGKWSIKCGKAKVEMTLLASSISGAPDVSGVDWTPVPDNFVSAAKLCFIAGNKTPFAGLFVSGDAMCSTNSLTINRHKFDGANLPQFWVEDAAIKGLFGFDGLKDLGVTDTWVHFKGEDGTVLSCRTKDTAGFPKTKFDAIIEARAKKPEDVAGQLPESLAAVISRAEVFGQEINGGMNAVKLILSRNAIEVKAERMIGKYSEEIELEQPLHADVDLVVGVDATFLKEACARVRDFYIAQEPGRPPAMVFQSEHYIQIASTISTGA